MWMPATEFEALAQISQILLFMRKLRFRIGLSVYRQSHTSSRDQTETKEATVFCGIFWKLILKVRC
jgi:hypothetical protein